MEKSECVEIGYISKAHGLQGEVKAVFDVYDLEEYLTVETLLFSKGDEPLREEVIEYIHPLSEKVALLKVKGIKYRDQAELLKGTTLFFPVSLLPELEDDHFYYFQVIGFKVVDEQLGALGTAKEFIDSGSQDILIMDYREKEVMIPVVDEFLIKVDKGEGIIYTRLPKGLLDLYSIE